MPSFTLIRATVWPQCTNDIDMTGHDRQDRQRTGSIGRTVLQTAAQKLFPCGSDGRILLSGFQAVVTLTLTLDPVLRHTVVHHSSTSIYTLNFIEIGKKLFFVDGLTTTPPSSRSRDIKTRTNIKNLVRSDLDVVL